MRKGLSGELNVDLMTWMKKKSLILGLISLAAGSFFVTEVRSTSDFRAAAVDSRYAFLSDEFDNGYPEDRYDYVLAAFKNAFGEEVAKEGAELHILKDWNDGAVNAWGWKEGSEWFLEVPGGMPRYHLINEEAFVLVLCHELGHLLGGAPSNGGGETISVEGQADYYSVQKCFRRFAEKVAPFYKLNVDLGARALEISSVCAAGPSAANCTSAMMGALALTGYYASVEGRSPPFLSTPDRTQVSATLETHPSGQCRLDTMLASARCPVNSAEAVSWQDPNLGYCGSLAFPEHARPRCWFAPR